MTISLNAGALDAQADQISVLIEAVEKADSSPSLFTAVRNLAAVADEAAIPALVAALSYNNPGAAIAAEWIGSTGETCGSCHYGAA